MKFKKILAGVLSAGVLMSSLPMSFAGVSAAELPQPVMKATFDDGTAKDVTGRGNNGTVVGSPEFVSGITGKAIHLVNSSEVAGQSKPAQQYVDFGKPADLQFGEGNFSLSFWMKSDRTISGHKEGAVVSNKDWYSGSNPGFCVGDMNQGVYLNFNTEGFSARKETDRFAQANDGNWHHIATTFDRKGNMVFYIDGKIYEPGNFNQSPATLNIADRPGTIDVFNFVIGADGKMQNSASDLYLDELSVYKQALTEAQVKELAKAEAKPAPKPVLKVNFDDSTAKDTSGKSHDGTVVGNPEFVEGVEGKAIRLQNADGIAAEHTTATQYVNFGAPDDLKFGTGDFSIMFWYKSNGSDPEEVAVVSNKDWNSGGNPGLNIGDMRNGMTLNFVANGAGRLDTNRITAATDNTWRHVAATFNRTGNMILYVDGKQHASTNISGQAGKSIDVGDFVLGADGMKNFSVKDSYIDELVVYKQVISPEEIAGYNAPYVLRNNLDSYEEMLETSTASQAKIDAFKAVIADIRATSQGVTDLDVIAELTAQLKRALNAFSGPDDGLINFEVISDTHIPGADVNNATNKKLIDVFEDLKRDYPNSAAVINSGDFSQDGSETQVKGYYNILDKYDEDFTVMTALGNHDVRWKSGWDEIYERYMRYNSKYMGETDGKVYYDKWINGYHFIVLNTEWDIKDRAYISPEQLDWLDKTMAEGADPNKPIFIAFHQALRDTYEISNDWNLGMQDHALKEVLRKYPQNIMFTGHLHDGLGKIEVLKTDYGVQVDVPSLKDNDQGDPRGQLGFHVSVYEDEVRLDLRDYLNDEWMPEYSYSISLDPASRPVGEVLSVDFDDETANDKSGHGNNGTLVGNPAFVEGANGGKAIHIVNSEAVANKDAKAEQYVDFGDKIKFGSDDITLMFDYKGIPSIGGDGCVISNKNWNSGANPGFALGVFKNAPGLGLNLNTAGGTRADTSRYNAATDGEWHTIAATFSRKGVMTLYIDGKAAGNKDISAHVGKSIDVEGLKLVLGADGNYQNSVRDMYIDNFKVYKKVIGAAEIESTWNPYKVTAGKTDVTISWPLPTTDSVEPAFLVLNGTKVADIASGETSKKISGLNPGTEYTILLVNREKKNTGNYRDVYPFVVTTKSEGVDKKELNELYNLNKNKTQGSYTNKSWKVFEDALAKAKDVLENESATAQMVKDAVDALNAAVEGLALKGDKTELNKLIAKAEGLDFSKYVDDKEVKIALAAALETAKNLSSDASEAEVSKTLKALADAIADLRLRADKSALKEWLEDFSNIDLTKYTDASAAVFQKALDKANEIMAMDLGEEDADVISDMVDELEAARLALELLPIDPEEPSSIPDEGSSSEDPAPGESSSSSTPADSSSTSSPETPKTGDAAPIAAVSLLAVAAAGAVLLMKKRRS